MLAIFPEISTAVQSGNIEQVAILARRYFCGDQPIAAPRVDVGRLVSHCGISVTRLKIRENGVIAVSDERGTIRCSIAVKENLGEASEAFLLAHLLGHFLLHIQPRLARSEWSSSGYREEGCALARYVHARVDEGLSASQRQMEDAADRFAGALLVPSAMLTKAHAALHDLDKVGRFFGVTRALIERRLDELAAPAQQSTPQIQIRAAASPRQAPEPEENSNHHGRVLKPYTKQKAPKEDTAHMVRETHHQAAPTPRAVATQSYSQGQDGEPAKPAPVSGKGMERLREIARLLDKSGR